MKLPILMCGPCGLPMRKIWEGCCDQAIFAIADGAGGYALVIDLARDYLPSENIYFVRWEDAYYCLEAKHWEPPRLPFKINLNP